MSRVYLLSALCWLHLGGLGLCDVVENVENSSLTVPFSNQLGGSINLGINWTVDDAIKEAIENNILALDSDEILKSGSASDGSIDYDVEVYVINDWNEILYAPPLPQFPELFQQVESEATENKLAMKMKTLFRPDGRPKMFIFYAVKRLTGDVANCIAGDTYSLITANIPAYLSEDSKFNTCIKR